MTQLYEPIDTLNTPYDAFYVDSRNLNDPPRPHWHYYIELIYVEEGTLRADYDRRSAVLHPGDLAVFYPKQIHTLSPEGCGRYRYGVIKFDVGRLTMSTVYTPKLRTLMETARNDASILPIVSKEDLAPVQAGSTFQTCIEELDRRNYGYDMIVQSALSSLLISVIRVFKDRGLNVTAQRSVPEEASIDSVTEYIDAHSAEPLLVEDLAKRCGMSYSYFARTFRRMYGRGCREYIEFVRVCKAEDLLLFTDFDLTYISQETGFSDCSHLIKTFKKWKNETPKQYRMRRNCPGVISES